MAKQKRDWLSESFHDAPLPELFTSSEWRALSKHLGLTPRQIEVARMICLGYTNQGIAQRLALSRDTVGLHCKQVFRRLKIRTRIGVPVSLVLAAKEVKCGRK